MIRTDNRPTVDEALEQAVAAMNDGARPWKLGEAAAQRIRDAYRADFETQLRRPRAWLRESPKVLRLARWAGSIAALLAETDAGPKGQPGEVPADHAFVASLAARHACPIPAAPRGAAAVAGRWCSDVSPSEAPKELLAKAASIFQPE